MYFKHGLHCEHEFILQLFGSNIDEIGLYESIDSNEIGLASMLCLLIFVYIYIYTYIYVMNLAYDIFFAKRIKAPGRGSFHCHNL